MAVSSGYITTNQNLPVTFSNMNVINHFNINDITIQQITAMYNMFEQSRVNTSTTNFVALTVRKSKSAPFQCAFDLNLLLQELQLMTNSVFDTTKYTYKLIEDRIHLYTTGDHFDDHFDSEDINIINGKHIATLLLILNTPYTGGDFFFYDGIQKNKVVLYDNVSIFKNYVNFIIFPLYKKHGVTALISGYRTVLKFRVIQSIKTFSVMQLNEIKLMDRPTVMLMQPQKFPTGGSDSSSGTEAYFD